MTLLQLAKAAAGEDYRPPKRDRRRLLDLVQLWHEMHGVSLKDNRWRLRKLYQLANLMGNPLAATITPMDAAKLRQMRLDNGLSANTINHDIAHLRAVFNVAMRLGEWHGKNPFAAIKAIRLPESELTYLTDEQIVLLFAALSEARNPDTALITEICFTTGARWSEAQTLRSENIHNGRVTYVGTKNGRSRSVPIDQDLYDRLKGMVPRLADSSPGTVTKVSATP